MKIRSVLCGLVLAISPMLFAQDATRIRDLLDTPIPRFRADKQDARAVLEGLGQAYKFPIILDADIEGEVSFGVSGGTLRMVMEAICAPKGWCYEVRPEGYMEVRRFVTRSYTIDYLQASQNSSSSGSISLSSAGTGTTGSGTSSSGSTTGTTSQNGSGSSGGGTASLSVSQENKADFWTGFEATLKDKLLDGEKLVVNKFAGVVTLTASLRTHAELARYMQTVMSRVRRQVVVSVQIIDVELSDQFQAGVDWQQAVTKAGGLTIGAVSTDTTAGIAGIGSYSFAAPTFNGTIAAGKLSAVLSALKEQGNTKIVSKPEISVMNNTTGYVQLSEDVPFFQRTDSFDAGTSTASTSTESTVRTNYSQTTLSFGNLLEVTAQISDAREVQLSLQPAITRMLDTVTSPDGLETAPKTGVKRLRSVVTLRDGESHVLGGFISEDEGTKVRSVPVVDAIPYLGKLFQSKGTYKTKQELCVLITVHVRETQPVVVQEVIAPSADRNAAPTVAQIPIPGQAIEPVKARAVESSAAVPKQATTPAAGRVERINPTL